MKFDTYFFRWVIQPPTRFSMQCSFHRVVSTGWPTFSNMIFLTIWMMATLSEAGLPKLRQMRKKCWPSIPIIHLWICQRWSFLRIGIPWDSSPFCTTIWGNLFATFSKQIKGYTLANYHGNGTWTSCRCISEEKGKFHDLVALLLFSWKAYWNFGKMSSLI